MGRVAGFLASRLDGATRLRAERFGLPAALGGGSYGRIVSAMTRRAQALRPWADLRDFDVLSDGTYQHRVAHSIWELRPAPEGEGEGYVLVRKREERLVDLRAQLCLSRPGPVPMQMPLPPPTVIVLNVHIPGDGDDNATAHESDDPFAPAPGSVPDVELDADGEDDAAREASLVREFHLARLVEAVSLDDADGKWVIALRSFRPELGGREVDEGDVFELEGWHMPILDIDRSYGVPRPALPYPSARPGDFEDLNRRVRLAPFGGGPMVFATLRELDRFFDLAGHQELYDVHRQLDEEPLEMPGDPVPYPPEDADADSDDDGGAGVENTGLLSTSPSRSRVMARRVLSSVVNGNRRGRSAPTAFPGTLLRSWNALQQRSARAHSHPNDVSDPARPHVVSAAPGAGAGRDLRPAGVPSWSLVHAARRVAPGRTPGR